MEFTRLSVLALICLALVGSDASQSGEDYWHSVWPNTPLPKTLSDLLMPYSEIPIKAKEEKQYWTVFFEHDLYPGKQMSLGVHKHSDVHHEHFQSRITKANQPFGARTWETRERDIQPFGGRTWETREKENQPFGARTWESHKEVSQPFGARTWEARKEVNQPFGARTWEANRKVSQPFGARTWETSKKVSQPFGARTWEARKEVSQPFGARTWETLEKVNQPFGARTWETRETENQPFGARTWETREKEIQPFGARTWGPRKESIDDYCGKPSAVGEEKYCALSLKSMMDFAISKLGTNIKVISSSFAQNRDQYVVEEVKKIGDKAVMCHRLNFERVVFYCHQVNATTAYIVPLVASDGIKAEALTICHHDTRGMNPDVLYDVLKVKPGTIPICHFVGNKAVAWVPNRDASNESNDHPYVI